MTAIVSSRPHARLSRAGVWLFDLDNTLYPASCNLFAQIDVRMRQFIAETLKMSEPEAYALQKKYYCEFGTTLRGLMLVHGLEPERFLSYVHDISLTALSPDPALADAVARLPGRRLIFTNGSERHARNVLDRLGLTALFDDIFDIVAADYIPKPQPETYQRLVARHGVDPRETVLFEDLARNLAPAAALGMTTVWVRNADHWTQKEVALPDDVSRHVDFETEDLARWLAANTP